MHWPLARRRSTLAYMIPCAPSLGPIGWRSSLRFLLLMLKWGWSDTNWGTTGTKMGTSTAQRPYFLWEYDLGEADVRAILRDGESQGKSWLVARILESAAYEDVWK